MSNANTDHLITAENAILDAALALAEVGNGPTHPVGKIALQRARNALLNAANSLHLAQIATAQETPSC